VKKGEREEDNLLGRSKRRRGKEKEAT